MFVKTKAFRLTLALKCHWIDLETVVDIIYLVMVATKRGTNLSDAEQAAISDQAKKEAREELLRELQQEKEEKK